MLPLHTSPNNSPAGFYEAVCLYQMCPAEKTRWESSLQPRYPAGRKSAEPTTTREHRSDGQFIPDQIWNRSDPANHWATASVLDGWWERNWDTRRQSWGKDRELSLHRILPHTHPPIIMATMRSNKGTKSSTINPLSCVSKKAQLNCNFNH